MVQEKRKGGMAAATENRPQELTGDVVNPIRQSEVELFASFSNALFLFDGRKIL